MREKWDACVVGGGPAGLAAGIAMRLRGLRVIVVDGMRPPIDKVCGEGLMPDSVTAMERLGVRVPPERARSFVGVRFIEGRREVQADFAAGTGLGVRRTVLHEAMVRRSEECGVALRWGTPVTELHADGISAGRERIGAHWVVGADGARSRIRRWAGIDGSTHDRRRYAYRRHYRLEPWSSRTEVYWSDAGQAYVTALGPEEICVAVISHDPSLRLEAGLQAFPELRARISGAQPISLERGTVTALHALRRVCRGNVALVGDASGSVDAITGEGLGLSFRQATVLAEAIRGGSLAPYQREHRRLARRPRWMARGLLALDGSRWLRRRVMRALGDAELFGRLLHVHTGDGPPRDVLLAGARLGLKLIEI